MRSLTDEQIQNAQLNSATNWHEAIAVAPFERVQDRHNRAATSTAAPGPRVLASLKIDLKRNITFEKYFLAEFKIPSQRKQVILYSILFEQRAGEAKKSRKKYSIISCAKKIWRDAEEKI